MQSTLQIKAILTKIAQTGSQTLVHENEIFKLLERAIQRECRVDLQIRAQGAKAIAANQVYQTKILKDSELGKSLHTGSVEPELRSQFLNDLRNNGGSECLLLIYLSKQILMGVPTELTWDTEKWFEFRFPKKLFLIQRRKHLRAEIPEDVEAFVELEHPTFSDGIMRRPILDFSAGGVSFLIRENERERFSVGTKLIKTSLRMFGEHFETPSEIVTVLPLARTNSQMNHRVGIRFFDLKPETQERLESIALALIGNLIF